MKINNLKNIIKEELRKIQLNENIVCSTENVVCDCSWTVDGVTHTSTCTGTRSNYCNGGYSDDCGCAAACNVRPDDPKQLYKRKN